MHALLRRRLRRVLATGGFALASVLAASAVLELSLRVFGDPSGHSLACADEQSRLGSSAWF